MSAGSLVGYAVLPKARSYVNSGWGDNLGLTERESDRERMTYSHRVLEKILILAV